MFTWLLWVTFFSFFIALSLEKDIFFRWLISFAAQWFNDFSHRRLFLARIKFTIVFVLFQKWMIICWLYFIRKGYLYFSVSHFNKYPQWEFIFDIKLRIVTNFLLVFFNFLFIMNFIQHIMFIGKNMFE